MQYTHAIIADNPPVENHPNSPLQAIAMLSNCAFEAIKQIRQNIEVFLQSTESPSLEKVIFMQLPIITADNLFLGAGGSKKSKSGRCYILFTHKFQCIELHS